MKEMNYFFSDQPFVNPISINQNLHLIRHWCEEGYKIIGKIPFYADYNKEKVVQVIEKNPANNKIILSYYAPCPFCGKLVEVGIIQ